MGGVIISPNIKKTSDRIDPAGNIINARTKQIIQPVESEYMPPVVQTVPEANYIPPQNLTPNSLTILEQIEQAKANLKQLQELKKLKIAEKEAELELLKQ